MVTGLQVAKNRHRLLRQGHDVLLAHLHASCRNSPFVVIKVELLPLRLAKLARAHEYEGREFERGLCRRVSPISLDRPQQLADLRGFRDAERRRSM